MPLTRISLRKGKTPEYHEALIEQIYLALRESMGTPEDDRFAVISEHDESGFNTSGDYGGIARSDDLVIIQITLLAGRSADQKKALYAAIANNLAESPGLRREDVFVSLIEVAKEDWSIGNGKAQYA